MVILARFGEGRYLDALAINQLAKAQQGIGMLAGGEVLSAPGNTTTENVRVKPGLAFRSDKHLVASSWTGDLGLSSRTTNPRQNTVYYKSSNGYSSLAVGTATGSPALVHPPTEADDISLAALYQPKTADGGLAKDDLRISPFLDQPQFCWPFNINAVGTYWETFGAGYTATLTTGGVWDILSGTGTGFACRTHEDIGSGDGAGLYDLTKAHIYLIRSRIKLTALTGVVRFGLAYTLAEFYSMTGQFFGLEMVNGNWYLMQYSPDWTTKYLCAADTNAHEFAFARVKSNDDSGWKLLGYVDGVLKGELATQAPQVPLHNIFILATKDGGGAQAHIQLKSVECITRED